jgi:hypothetical protein
MGKELTMTRNWLPYVAIALSLIAGGVCSTAFAQNKSGFKFNSGAVQNLQSSSGNGGSNLSRVRTLGSQSIGNFGGNTGGFQTQIKKFPGTTGNTAGQNLGISGQNLGLNGRIQGIAGQNSGLGGRIQGISGQNLGISGQNLQNRPQIQIGKGPSIVGNGNSSGGLGKVTGGLGISIGNGGVKIDPGFSNHGKSDTHCFPGGNVGCLPGKNPVCSPCKIGCKPWWWGCYSWCSPTYKVCYPVVYTQPIVVQVPVAVPTPVGVAVEQPLMQIPLGATVTLQALGLGDAAGQVVIQIDKVVMPAMINEWRPDAVTATLPTFTLAAPQIAEIVLVRADGNVANVLKVELVNAQQEQQAAQFDAGGAAAAMAGLSQ